MIATSIPSETKAPTIHKTIRPTTANLSVFTSSPPSLFSLDYQPRPLTANAVHAPYGGDRGIGVGKVVLIKPGISVWFGLRSRIHNSILYLVDVIVYKGFTLFSKQGVIPIV